MIRAALGASVGWLGISLVADGVPTLLLPHRLVEEGVSGATALGLATLLAIAVAAVVQPLAGRWSDRVGRFPVVATGSASAIGGLALLAAPGMAMAGTVVTLAGVSVAQAGYQALLPDRIGPAWRGRASGLKGAFDVGGAFLGFVLLAVLLGAGLALWAVALVAVVLVAGLAASRLLLGSVPPAGALARRPLLDAYRFDLVEHRRFAVLLAARFLFLVGIYAVGRFLLLFVADRLGLGADAAAEQAGIALAALALVTVAASVPSGWLADRVGRRPVMVAGGILAATGIALLPLADGIAPILAFGSLMALGSAAFGAASWAMLADLVATHEAGRMLGIANMATAAAAALAGAFGLLIDSAGFGVGFGIAAGCTVAGGLLAWRLAERTEPAGQPIATTRAVL